MLALDLLGQRHISGGQQLQALRYGRGKQQRADREPFAALRCHSPAIARGLHAGHLGTDARVESLGVVLRNRRHSGDATETLFTIALESAVGQRKASCPWSHDSRRLPRFDQQTKMRIVRGERLRPVVERAVRGPLRR